MLAVAAADEAGAFCSFAARGAGLDLLGPGCALDMSTFDGQPAFGMGSSHATAFVSGILTALRAYRPDLTDDEAERLLVEGAGTSGVVNAEATFRAAGLGGIVDAGNAARASATAPPPSSPAPNAPNAPNAPSGPTGGTVPIGPEVAVADVPPSRPPLATEPLATPRVTVRYRSRRLVVRVTNRPSGADVVLRTYRGGRGTSGGRVVLRRTSSRAKIEMRTRRPSYITVRFEDRAGRRPASKTVRRPIR